LDFNLFLGVAGLLVGLAGFGFALYQGSERKKLERYLRSQNWHLYSKANNSNGSLQKAFDLYKANHSGHLSPDVVEWLSKADAFGQDVFKDIVRQIQLAEPKFDEQRIEAWVETGKVSDQHAKELFRKILVEN
jgi:hypothetical protein